MSPRTIYLSRLIGLFTLVIAMPMLVDKPQAMEAIKSIVQDRSALIIIGILGTVVGLAIVLGYQIWSNGVLSVVVTVLRWIILVRGIVVLLLPPPATAQLLEWFRVEEFFYHYLGFAAAVGLYLTVHGFVAAAPRWAFPADHTK